MQYSRRLKAISLSMAFVMLFTNTAPLKAYAAGLQEEVQDAMAGVTVQVSPEAGTSVEPGSEPQSLSLEPAQNPEESAAQDGSSQGGGQDGAQQDNAAATPSPIPTTTPAATETPTPTPTPGPTETPTAMPEPTATPVPTEMPETTATPKPTVEPASTETTAVMGLENEIATSESANSLILPQGDVIEINTYEELQLLGTGETVDGVTYAADGQYTIAQDIELPSSTAWTLPENFTGRIAPEEASEDRTVYDAESDTIYVYHRFQLAVMAQENAADEPVMDGDATTETFGMGQLIYPNGTEQPYLTYSPEHRYVISTQFCSDVPVSTYANEVEVPGPNSDGTRQYEGRDFPGQVIKTINGVDYILIGNEEQLRAIGSGKQVYSAVYQAKLVLATWYVDTDDGGNPILLYGGDADLLQSQNGKQDYELGQVENASGALTGRCGVNQKTGQIDPNMDIDDIEHKYDADENYIIFRDIDLSSANWTPLMFSGTMIGAKAANSSEKSTLWLNDEGGIENATFTDSNIQRPVISNVKIVQPENQGIDVENTKGIGFFATIASEMDVNTLSSKQLVAVRNIELKNVHVENNTDQIYVSSSLINGVLGVVGGAVGILLDGLLRSLGIEANLTDVLTSLLDAHKGDVTALATAAFAGRVTGKVEIENCSVSGDVSVYNVNSITGGFVGYTNGTTRYATAGIGNLIEFLSNLLNLIPGLGLGDIITILLGNALPLDQLIPVGYDSPLFTDCTVTGLTGVLGQSTTNYNGGFVGQQIGTQMINCRVQNSTFTVQAASYGGGFAGLARDAEIKGMLQEGLGIELASFGQPESLLLNCTVEGWAPSTSAQDAISGGSYLGGFVGALANSYTVNCDITMADEASLSVNGSGSYIGGWSGTATIGWATNLGKGEQNDTTLLGGVTELLESLLASGDDTSALLSLAGVAPSAIMGCQISGSGVSVHAGGDYAGGFVGSGDGLYLTSASPANLENLSYWRTDKIAEYPEQRKCSIDGLTSVSADGSYAGGIAGSLGGASVGGLLNSTVGLGEFLGFTVSDISLTGGYTVEAAGDYAGGAFGMAMAGDASNITINGITNVSARNNAGGFIGLGGPGSLATVGEGGLTLNLLGLDNLISLSNVLSVIPGVKMTLTNCTVTGGENFTVRANGGEGSTLADYATGGFIGRGNSTDMTNCHVSGLVSVFAPTQPVGNAGESGFAGGFVGISRNDDLADVLDSNGEGSDLGSLIQVDQLLGAAPVLMSKYTNCTVTFADVDDTTANVSADVAGGFAADFQSGTVDNSSRGENNYHAVYNISRVAGRTYAGGFAGKLYSGALANSNGGVSILDGIGLNLNDLLTVVGTYVPTVKSAGVDSSEQGLVVTATDTSGETGDLNAGSAGGFAGYASGAQISTCDVNFLRHTTVNDPANAKTADADLVTDGASYYEDGSSYAVTGGRYAGGFIGKIDLGSAASVGGGLEILGDSISLSSVLDALNVVVTTIEHSDVYGAAGGYAVRADAAVYDKQVGHAGGFAGVLYGGHIQDSNAHNFSHIIGRQTAGGYVGEMQPGNVASVLGDGTILDGLVDVDGLLSGLEIFVPTIRNSSTDSVPCGGVVWAQVSGEQAKTEGMAGGYAGHNEGGQILGLNTKPWLAATEPYAGPTSVCKALRIRTVFGSLYAGGYTGFMEAADTAETGGLSLLGGLIQTDNLLSVLSIVYPFQENTAVYGPLVGLDVETWNIWVDAVGTTGGYGFELAQAGKVSSQDELNAKLANYIYGYDVYTSDNDTARTALASAGGYVGLMRSGVLTNCMAYDAKQVQAPGAAGGFAGRMETGGAANFGKVNILDLELDIGQLLSVVEVFVPVVENSSVQGYRSGLTVTATGTPEAGVDAGNAGGFVGAAYGAQIQLNSEGFTAEEQKPAWIIAPDAPDQDTTAQYPAPIASCDVRNLRRVAGRGSVGGYVGLATAASLASVDTNASDGLLQGILDSVISNAGNLIKLLPATVTTIHQASVSPADPDWGFVVDGAYTDTNGTPQYAPYAGGFVGQAQAAFLGEDQGAPGGDDEGEKLTNLTVTGLRQVDGGLYAGGFVGLGDVGAVAQVGGAGEDGPNKTTILDELLGGLLGDLAELNPVDALDVLRTYIYHASVTGVEEGYRVQAHANPQPGDSAGVEGSMGEKRYAGCAGGFAGAMLNGTILDSTAANAATVKAANYTGGFIGHMGKSGVVDVDNVSLLDKLVSANAGVLDLFGTQVQRCTLTGYANGLEVQATSGQQPIAGGFVGYGDLGRVDSSTVTALKKVSSDQVAGGFIGQTDMAYLVSLEADSPLVKALLIIVNKLLDYLYLDEDELQDINLVDLNLGVLNVEVLNDGNALKVELLGIPIVVALSKASAPGQEDVAIITIGDSEIRLPCAEDKPLTADDLAEVEINLIKGNRTEVDSCNVTGINEGYDVFAGGAEQDVSATCDDKTGSAGGFVGYNHEGKISNSKMVLCDVIKGTATFVGPFTGYNDLKSVYNFNDIASIEGDGNQYSIYRAFDPTLTHISSGDNLLGSGDSELVTAEQDTSTGVTYNRYDIDHIQDFENVIDTGKEMTVYDMFKALDGAVMTGDEGVTPLVLNAYQENGAKAVLMLDTPTEPNPETTVPEPGVGGDPCAETVDLTVQKIWDDWFGFGGNRPASVTLTIYQQQYTLQDKTGAQTPNYPAQGQTDMVWAPYGEKNPYTGSGLKDGVVTLTKADQESVWSAVWSTVLRDAPVFAFEDQDSDNVWDEGEEITAYYVYTVEEQDVPDGYEAIIENYDPTDAGDYELTVINKRSIPLPDTGAGGDVVFVMVGVGILLLGLTLTKRRRPRKGER